MRTCTVCKHQQREKIDEAILSGTSFRSIADRFGPSKSALIRHRVHITNEMARASGDEKKLNAAFLIEKLDHLREKAENILHKAEESGSLPVALSAIRESRSTLQVYIELALRFWDTKDVQPVSVTEVIGVAADFLRKHYPEAYNGLKGYIKEVYKADIDIRNTEN